MTSCISILSFICCLRHVTCFSEIFDIKIVRQRIGLLTTDIRNVMLEKHFCVMFNKLKLQYVFIVRLTMFTLTEEVNHPSKHNFDVERRAFI